MPSPGWRTRFAPAPTGLLHLGHLVNAIHVWGMARAHDGRVVLRIEDHDRTRCRAEYESALLDDLDWLGFVPDEATTDSFRRGPSRYRQSDNGGAYEMALRLLVAQYRVYACVCSRRDIQQSVGTTAPGEEPRYPGTCREAALPFTSTRARRVHLDDDTVSVHDLLLGVQEQHPAAECGDVLVRDRFGHWTYQFAVVVDDYDQGIDVVIRGEDLLPSTGRQVLLGRLLGRVDPPRYLHHPLIRHADGRKLSKAAHDTSLQSLRESGATPASLIGEAAFRCGLTTAPRPLQARDVAALFS